MDYPSRGLAPKATRPPDYQKVWSVWKMPITPEPGLTALAMALIDAPGVHAFWRCYFVTLIHLRDVPGAAPAKKRYPEAGYEIVVWALRPDRAPDPSAHPVDLMNERLTPPNVVHQFHGFTDTEVVERFDRVLQHIAAAAISPDSDHRSVWEALFAPGAEFFTVGPDGTPA